MWKKIMIALVTLVSTFSIGYAYFNFKMNAASSYNIGGNVYGRIGSPITGDRIYLGTKNADGEKVGWVLVDKFDGATGQNFTGNNAWIANSTNVLAKNLNVFNDCSTTCNAKFYEFTYDAMTFKGVFDEFNQRLQQNNQDYRLIANKNMEWYEGILNEPYLNQRYFDQTVGFDVAKQTGVHVGQFTANPTLSNFFKNDRLLANQAYSNAVYVRRHLILGEYGANIQYTDVGNKIQVNAHGERIVYPFDDSAYYQTPHELCYGNTQNDTQCNSASVQNNLKLPPFEKYRQELESSFKLDDVLMIYWEGYYPVTSTSSSSRMYYIINDGKSKTQSFSTYKAAWRGSVELKIDELNKTVFAVSQPVSTGNGYVDISDPVTTYGNYYSKEHLKLRLMDPSMQVSFEDILYKNDSIYTKQGITKTDTAKVEKGKSVELKINGNSGSNQYGTNTISALIFDANDNFIKYQPLAITEDGSHLYELDFDNLGLNVGTYTIKVVNEKYNSDLNETSPADCSDLSQGFKVNIVDPLTIQYQPSASTYTYNDNVKVGNTIGSLTFNNGVTPHHVVFDSSKDDDNFEFSKSEGIDNGAITIKVKPNALSVNPNTNSLNAGTYEFCMIAYDVNDEPDPFIEGKTKVCATIHVNKIDASIAFDDPAQTKKSIADAGTPWNETASSTPMQNMKITYSITGGDVSIADIDSDTGQITYKGNDAFGKITIRATVDDDPATGYDNYNSAYVEKDIIIYREVDGVVTPDSASSDINVPTFSMDQANIKTNGTIGTIKGTRGTPDTIGGSVTTYNYVMKSGGNASMFKVNASTGIITSGVNLGVGTYTFTITVSDKWSSKDISVQVNVGMAPAENLKFYENAASNTMITQKSAKITDTGVVVFATVKGSSNNNPVTYKLKPGEPTNVIDVNPNSGAVTIKNVGTVVIVAEKQGANGQANAYTELTFTVTAGSQEFIYVDNSGNELSKTQNRYDTYEEVYGKNKTFNLHTDGSPPGSNVTYTLKAGSPTDVITVDSDGTVHILNASLNTQKGKVIVEATSHDPSGNYTDKTIELPIDITKADQTISFADVTHAPNGKGTVTPIINEQDLSSNEGGATIDDPDYYISIGSSGSGIAWTNNGIDIDYNYDKDNGIDIPIHVEKPGNRNYNKAEADGMLKILGKDESTLAISQPGKIVYGDHFTIKSLQDDSSSANVQYTFTVDNTTYISNPTVNGNLAEFDALKFSGNTEITIKVVRTADGEVALSKEVKVKVLPKPIDMVIDDQTKLFGEPNPTLTYQDFSAQLVSWNGVMDQILPGDIQLSTTAQNTSPAGTYPITGDSKPLNNKYTDYSFTFTNGTLTVHEEEIKEDWYHLELDDGNHTPYNGNWTNQDVNIVSDHNEYSDVSIDKIAWNPNYATVVNEGSYPQSFWMKKTTGATTKEKQADVKIDKKPPIVKNIKEKTIKIKESITIQTDDTNGTLDVSGTKSIDVRITKQVQTKTRSNGNIVQDTIEVKQESASVIMDQSGTFEVCAIPTDNAGNVGNEKCEMIKVKKIDYDEDGDGDLDFNDPDGDGCPDLNIVLGKDDDGDWIKLNVDKNKDNIPELNIDTDGDGKADINIDTDNDGKPDLNIVNVTTWKPTYCVLGQEEEYCTDQTLIPNINVDLDGDGRPDINIDLDDDGIPDIDIDTDGDGKPDINIDINHDGTPDENINKLSKWEIGKEVYEVNGQKFQTMPNLKPDGNDTLEDNGIKIEKPDGTPFLPNFALKVEDVTDTEKEEVSEQVKDMIKDQEVKKVFDVKLLKDNVEVQPDGRLKVKIPYQDIKNPILLRKNANGVFEKVNFTIEDGYLIYETDELGIVSIVGDKEFETSVKGTYTPNVGGAITGDETNISFYLGSSLFTMGILSYLLRKRNKQKDTFQ